MCPSGDNTLTSLQIAENLKNLKCVLKQVFMDTPDDRLVEIENILIKEEIYLGSDLKIADTNELRENTSLRGIELLKIKLMHYLIQSYIKLITFVQEIGRDMTI